KARRGDSRRRRGCGIVDGWRESPGRAVPGYGARKRWNAGTELHAGSGPAREGDDLCGRRAGKFDEAINQARGARIEPAAADLCDRDQGIVGASAEYVSGRDGCAYARVSAAEGNHERDE